MVVQVKHPTWDPRGFSGNHQTRNDASGFRKQYTKERFRRCTRSLERETAFLPGYSPPITISKYLQYLWRETHLHGTKTYHFRCRYYLIWTSDAKESNILCSSALGERVLDTLSPLRRLCKVLSKRTVGRLRTQGCLSGSCLIQMSTMTEPNYMRHFVLYKLFVLSLF